MSKDEYSEMGKQILRAVFTSAVFDYNKYVVRKRLKPKEALAFSTASRLLFDDDYRILYGDWELSLEELLSVINDNKEVDLEIVRENIINKAYQRKSRKKKT